MMGEMGTKVMRRTLRRNLLEDAVGRAIWCPKCSKTLDARSTLLFTHPEKRASVVCMECAATEGDVATGLSNGCEIDAWNWTRGGEWR